MPCIVGVDAETWRWPAAIGTHTRGHWPTVWRRISRPAGRVFVVWSAYHYIPLRWVRAHPNPCESVVTRLFTVVGSLCVLLNELIRMPLQLLYLQRFRAGIVPASQAGRRGFESLRPLTLTIIDNRRATRRATKPRISPPSLSLALPPPCPPLHRSPWCRHRCAPAPRVTPQAHTVL